MFMVRQTPVTETAAAFYSSSWTKKKMSLCCVHHITTVIWKRWKPMTLYS